MGTHRKLKLVVHSRGPVLGEQPGPEGGRSESQLTFATITPE